MHKFMTIIMHYKCADFFSFIPEYIKVIGTQA
jgi:hypothetical protein